MSKFLYLPYESIVLAAQFIVANPVREAFENVLIDADQNYVEAGDGNALGRITFPEINYGDVPKITGRMMIDGEYFSIVKAAIRDRGSMVIREDDDRSVYMGTQHPYEMWVRVSDRTMLDAENWPVSSEFLERVREAPGTDQPFFINPFYTRRINAVVKGIRGELIRMMAREKNGPISIFSQNIEQSIQFRALVMPMVYTGMESIDHNLT